MALQLIYLGATPNDTTGTDLRTGGDLINDNFIELYARTANLEVTSSTVTSTIAETTYVRIATGSTGTGLYYVSIGHNVTGGDKDIVIGAGSYGEVGGSGENVVIGYSSSIGGGAGGGNVAVGSNIFVDGFGNIVLGEGSLTTSDYVVVVGQGATATGYSSIAMGWSADATQNQAVSIGPNSRASGIGAVALGSTADADNDYAVAIGWDADVSGVQSVSVGYESFSGESSVAIGDTARATSKRSVVIGRKSVSSYDDSISIGNNATGSANASVAVGNKSSVTGDSAVVMGSNSSAVSSGSVAIGSNSNTVGQGTVAVGFDSDAIGEGSIAIGELAQSVEAKAISIGKGSTTLNIGGITIGDGAVNQGKNSVAVGKQSSITLHDSVAFGQRATTLETSSIAIGANSTTTDAEGMAIGHSTYASGSRAVVVGSNIRNTVNNVTEVGQWDLLGNRSGSIRIHSTGMVGLTLQDRESAYTDGGTVAGDEVDNSLMRDGYAFRRSGSSLVVDHNLDGTIHTITFGLSGSAVLGSFEWENILNVPEQMYVVEHGSDPDYPRPSASAVYWIGGVEPNQAIDADLWYDSASQAFVETASFSFTSSVAITSITSSYALYALTVSGGIDNAISSSYAETASYAFTASHALTAWPLQQTYVEIGSETTIVGETAIAIGSNIDFNETTYTPTSSLLDDDASVDNTANYSASGDLALSFNVDRYFGDNDLGFDGQFSHNTARFVNGVSYEYIVDVRTDDSPSTSVQLLRANGTGSSTIISTLSVDSSWNTFSGSFTMGADITHNRPAFRIFGFPSSAEFRNILIYSSASSSSISIDGVSPQASGTGSIAIGSGIGSDSGSYAEGDYSMALGFSSRASGSQAVAIGSFVKSNISNITEIGQWDTSNNRSGSIRIHSTGMVETTLEDRDTPYTDGGTIFGSELDGTLIRDGIAFRRSASALVIDHNIDGTIYTLNLGISGSVAGGGGSTVTASYALTASYVSGLESVESASYVDYANIDNMPDKMFVVNHGANANYLRPEAVAVYWIGDVEPVSASDSDLWYDSASQAFVETASFSFTSSYSLSAGSVMGGVATASYALTAGSVVGGIATASYALTASSLIGGIGTSDTASYVDYANIDNMPEKMFVVVHGSDSGSVRPTAAAVYWIGDVEPINATDADLWYNSSSQVFVESASYAKTASVLLGSVVSSSYSTTSSYSLVAGSLLGSVISAETASAAVDFIIQGHLYADEMFAATTSIDWTNGNMQTHTLVTPTTFSFVDPLGPTTLILKLVQDDTGSRTVYWSGSNGSNVYWSGGTQPTLTAVTNSIDFVTFIFDGSTYHGDYSLDSKPSV